LLGIFACLCLAQSAQYVTHWIVNGRPGENVAYRVNLTNGRSWKAGLEGDHLAYLAGALDACNEELNCDAFWPAGLLSGDVEQSLDLFYSDGANANIPIRAAIRIIAARVAGATPSQDAEAISRARAKSLP